MRRLHRPMLYLGVAALNAWLACQAHAVQQRVARYTLDDDTAGLQNQGTDGATSNLTILSGNSTGGATGTPFFTGPPTFTPAGGILGGYATFTGTQGLIVKTAGNAADDLTGFPWSLSAWVRPQHQPQANVRAAAVGISNTTNVAQYYTLGIGNPISEGEIAQAARRNTGFVPTNDVAPLVDLFAAGSKNGWHMITIVNPSPTKSKLYVDGVLKGTSTTEVQFETGVNALTIGGFMRSSNFGDVFLGDIDEVQLFNFSLGANEVTKLYVTPNDPIPRLAGDVNLDGHVNNADLQLIADNFFTSVDERAFGDLTDDGIVNFADFAEWKAAPKSEVAATLADYNVVPEPESMGLAAVGVAASMARLRARQRR